MAKNWEEKKDEFEKIRLIPEAAMEIYKDANDRKNG